MKLETKCLIAETVCESLIGAAAGLCVQRAVIPKLENRFEIFVLTAGGAIAGTYLGSKFGRDFFKTCDKLLETNCVKEFTL